MLCCSQHSRRFLRCMDPEVLVQSKLHLRCSLSYGSFSIIRRKYERRSLVLNELPQTGQKSIAQFTVHFFVHVLNANGFRSYYIKS